MNIAVFTKNWIGDVVFLEPAIGTIKRNIPYSRIIAICPKRCIPVLEANPNIAEIIPFDDRTEDRGFVSKWRLIRRLKALDIKRIYIFHRSWSRAALAYFSGIPERIGYDTKRRGFWLTQAVRELPEPIHSVDSFLKLLELSGLEVPAETRNYRFYFSDEDKTKAKSLLQNHRLHPDRLIALNPGANWLPKRWPIGHFKQLARELVQKYRAEIMVTGGSQDLELARALAGDSSNSSIVSLCGQTSLRELGALYSMCRLVISNDSGPLHIGAGVGTNVIGIFGPTDPKLTGPRGSGCNVVLHYVPPGEQAPWYGKHFPFGKWMEQISVRQVLDAIDREGLLRS